VLDRNRMWVGYATGNMYYTRDGGETWTIRSFLGSGTGAVKAIKFVDDYVGYVVHNTAAPVGYVLFTFDGGYTWERLTSPTNSGYNAIFASDEWKFFLAGEANGASGFVAVGEV